MIYFFMFFCSTLFVWRSEYLYKKKRKSISYIIIALMLVMLSVFAGIRDTSVGTDVEYYVVKHFNWVKMFAGHPFQYIGYMYSFEEVDPLYAMILYIGSHVFHSINFVLVVLSFITNFFAYMAIKSERNRVSVSTSWMIYCLLFFNTSLNILRQASAVAIVFYIMVLLVNKKITMKKFILFGLFAIFLHRSSIIMLIVLPILIYLTFRNKRKWLLNLMVALLCLIPFSFGVLSGIISKFSFLPVKYSVYFLSLNAEQSRLFLEAIIYSLPTFVLGILLLKKKKMDTAIKFYFALALVSICECMATNLLISRLSYYLVIFFTISVPYSARVFSTKFRSRLMYNAIMILWFAVMWYVNIIGFGYGETYPYIIGI